LFDVIEECGNCWFDYNVPLFGVIQVDKNILIYE